MCLIKCVCVPRSFAHRAEKPTCVCGSRGGVYSLRVQNAADAGTAGLGRTLTYGGGGRGGG